jgi:hypothetical protein
MPLHKFPAVICLISTGLLLKAQPVSSIMMFSSFLCLADHRPYFVRRQTGNQNASGDLYGIGIRVGAYLQVLGMLLACLRSEKRTRSGIKLLSSAICVSLLVSCTVLIRRQNISPCETWLVLSLINAYGTPREAALNNSGVRSGGVAAMFSVLSVVWQDILFIWFFAKLITDLPLLGTNNRAWFFAEVNLLGWFRILMLVYSSFCCLIMPAEIVCTISIIANRFREWSDGSIGEPVTNDAEPESPPDHWATREWSKIMHTLAQKLTTFTHNIVFQTIRAWVKAYWLFVLKHTAYRKKTFYTWEEEEKVAYGEVFVRTCFCIYGFVILVLTIAGVEKIIDYNNLVPQNDLSQPGQLIPFVLGIITVVEGAASACIPKPLGPSDPTLRRTSTITVVEDGKQLSRSEVT